MKKKALISACLLGLNCRYDGKNNKLSEEKLARLKEGYELIPVCPECYGGLTTPRVPSERLGERVLSREGLDVTQEFCKGAEAALCLAEAFDAKLAILKEKSPSCGHGIIYDGSFTGRLTEGDGVTAQLLSEHGIEIIGETKI